MGHFTEEIAIEPAGGKLWKVTRAFAYITDQSERIDIPIGFVFDGASIPKVAWFFIGHPLDQEYLAPSAIHDNLYRTQEFSRSKTDYIFKQAMRDNGVSYLKRTVMWSFCRTFGWIPWKLYKTKFVQWRRG